MKVDVSSMAYGEVQGIMKGVFDEVEGFRCEGERVFVQVSNCKLQMDLPTVA